MSATRNRLLDVILDAASLAAANADAEHERRIAIHDLREANSFELEGADAGPYVLHLSLADGRLVFQVRTEAGDDAHRLALSLSPFRKVIKDYFLICDSYAEAIRAGTPTQIETLDMGRRGIHDEGSAILIERLSGKARIDHETARRLFTLICALHVRN